MIALREGINTGSLVQLDASMVERHNIQQSASCSRFVYGPTSDFADVESLLRARPEYRDVKSSMRFGKMGYGPGPRRHMPMGSWLVLFGRTTAHMLEVMDAGDDEPLEVTLKSSAALRAAADDGPFSEMQYFVDQHQLRSMRDVGLLPIGDSDSRRVQVRHSDPGLDALMQKKSGSVAAERRGTFADQ